MDVVILKCVREGSKLRIRFHSFVDKNGNIYNNAYDNTYNCRFPKSIRKEGCFYQIPSNDISLVRSRSVTQLFYTVKKNNIVTLENWSNMMVEEDDEEKVWLDSIKIYDAGECILCMDDDSEKVFIPCGHRCTCSNCWEQSQDLLTKCPMCRRDIGSCV